MEGYHTHAATYDAYYLLKIVEMLELLFFKSSFTQKVITENMFMISAIFSKIVVLGKNHKNLKRKASI